MGRGHGVLKALSGESRYGVFMPQMLVTSSAHSIETLDDTPTVLLVLDFVRDSKSTCRSSRGRTAA